MLKTLFPQRHVHYRSLPLLGPIVDRFVGWLADRGYRERTLRAMVRALSVIDRWLGRDGVAQLADMDAEILERCWRSVRRQYQGAGGVVRALAKYLDSQGLLRTVKPAPLTPNEQLVRGYAHYLKTLRGFAQSSISNHSRTAAQFVKDVSYDADSGRLALASSDLEDFVRARGQQLSRASLQQVVAHLRGFLRFLATRTDAPLAQDSAIDTPRIYRHEQLPRSLPWETVRALLGSIDRKTVLGLRDYTMIFLIATYGLRIGEVAALTLDDIEWRHSRLRVPRSKTQDRLLLPLTDHGGSVLLDYLRHGRPAQAPCRHLFVRNRAPVGPLTPSAVSMAFAQQAKRSGLEIPFSGAHCLRHSYAVNLLRDGTSLKTIGDLLGHRSTESTCVYLRLATEDLREVPLSVPRTAGCPGPEVRG